MKIKFIFWDDDTGYGISARLLIKALLDKGISVIPIGLKQNKKKSSEYQLQTSKSELTEYDLVFIHTSPYYIRFYIEPGKVNIAYCTWETTHLPQKWVTEVNKCTAVFVSSKFIKKCFLQSGVHVPIHIIAHLSEFQGKSTLYNQKINEGSDFTFYSIGMWSTRKNYLALLQAFSKAFSNNERVRLVIKTSKKDYTKPAIDLFKKFGLIYYFNLHHKYKIRKILNADPRIHLITQKWSSDQIAQLHFSSDCYISLCKSEGWGLGAYEAAWFGNPVIITGFGGQLDFLDKKYATLLPFSLVKTKDHVWAEYNEEGQEWAEVDVESAIQAMKDIYQNRIKFAQQGKQLKQYVSEHFDINQILDSFIQNIQLYVSTQ